MPLFNTFGGKGETVGQQFLVLIQYAYIGYLPQFQNDESKLHRIKNDIFNDITVRNPLFEHSDFRTYTKDELPSSLDRIYELYLADPITDKYRDDYLDRYTVPFFKTEKTLKQLYEINPEVMNETLQLLMLSKKLQYIRFNILDDLCYKDEPHFRVQQICKTEQFKTDLAIAREKYINMLGHVEGQIAIKWIDAVEKEPRFKNISGGGKSLRNRIRKNRKTRKTRKTRT